MKANVGPAAGQGASTASATADSNRAGVADAGPVDLIRAAELTLGRNDLCPCGSRRRFQEVQPEERAPRRVTPELLPTRLTLATAQLHDPALDIDQVMRGIVERMFQQAPNVGPVLTDGDATRPTVRIDALGEVGHR